MKIRAPRVRVPKIPWGAHVHPKSLGGARTQNPLARARLKSFGKRKCTQNPLGGARAPEIYWPWGRARARTQNPLSLGARARAPKISWGARARPKFLGARARAQNPALRAPRSPPKKNNNCGGKGKWTKPVFFGLD